jgi:hypothetical protein
MVETEQKFTCRYCKKKFKKSAHNTVKEPQFCSVPCNYSYKRLRDRIIKRPDFTEKQIKTELAKLELLGKRYKIPVVDCWCKWCHSKILSYRPAMFCSYECRQCFATMRQKIYNNRNFSYNYTLINQNIEKLEKLGCDYRLPSEVQPWVIKLLLNANAVKQRPRP